MFLQIRTPMKVIPKEPFDPRKKRCQKRGRVRAGLGFSIMHETTVVWLVVGQSRDHKPEFLKAPNCFLLVLTSFTDLSGAIKMFKVLNRNGKIMLDVVFVISKIFVHPFLSKYLLDLY